MDLVRIDDQSHPCDRCQKAEEVRILGGGKMTFVRCGEISRCEKLTRPKTNGHGQNHRTTSPKSNEPHSRFFTPNVSGESKPGQLSRFRLPPW